MIRRAIDFFKQVFKEMKEDDVTVHAASVAYYAALSLAPMVLLFVAITGFLGEGTQLRMFDTVTSTVGEEAGQSVRTIASETADTRNRAGLSLAVSLVVVLYSASRVMSGLQLGLNRVWHVRNAPGAGWKDWVRKRLLSMGMVLGVGFLLLVSMVATTVVGMVLPSSGWMWNLATMVVGIGVFTLLFAAIFKVLPDVRIAWRDVWLGAAVTAGLFAVGKFLVSLYLARAGFATSYGAAGSLVVLLVWVYFSSMIVFVGSEITQVVARRSGRPIEADDHAEGFKKVSTGRETEAAA